VGAGSLWPDCGASYIGILEETRDMAICGKSDLTKESE